jgi:hypothetical protein
MWRLRLLYYKYVMKNGNWDEDAIFILISPGNVGAADKNLFATVTFMSYLSVYPNCRIQLTVLVRRIAGF